jgi:hypothetical protein
MYSDLVAQIRTRQEADQLLLAVRQLKQGQYSQSEVQVPSVLTSGLESASDKQAWLAGLEQELTALPEVGLTLTVAPSESLLDSVATWIKTNLEPKAVVALKLDRQILGGAQISYQGKYADYSVRHALDAALKEWQTSKTI